MLFTGLSEDFQDATPVRLTAAKELPIPESAPWQPLAINHAAGCRPGTDLPTYFDLSQVEFLRRLNIVW